MNVNNYWHATASKFVRLVPMVNWDRVEVEVDILAHANSSGIQEVENQ